MTQLKRAMYRGRTLTHLRDNEEELKRSQPQSYVRKDRPLYLERNVPCFGDLDQHTSDSATYTNALAVQYCLALLTDLTWNSCAHCFIFHFSIPFFFLNIIYINGYRIILVVITNLSLNYPHYIQGVTRLFLPLIFNPLMKLNNYYYLHNIQGLTREKL